MYLVIVYVIRNGLITVGLHRASKARLPEGGRGLRDS